MMAFLSRLGLAFTPELVDGSRVLALVSTLGLVVLFFYVGRRTERGGYSLWAIAWIFYALNLAGSIASGLLTRNQYVVMIPSACIAVGGLLMLCGNLQVLGRRIGYKLILVAALALAGLDYFATIKSVAFWFAYPASCLLGGSAIHAGILLYNRQRKSGSVIMATIAFVLWGLLTIGAPLLARFAPLTVASDVVAAICLMIIGMGTIIDHEIESTEQKYRSVLDATNDAIFMVDLWTLKILDVNTVGGRLARREVTDLIGTSFLNFCPDLRQEGTNVLDHRKMFSAVFKPYNEFHFVRADGGMVLCEGDTNLAQWHKRPVVQVRMHEVGADKNIGQLVRRAEKMSSLGQLVAGVAHELNNPLAVVMGYAQILAKHPIEDATMRENLQRIHHEAERAAKIVRDLLAFARPCEPQVAPVDINHLVCNVLDVREEDFAKSNVELRQNLKRDLSKTKADPIQIEQVLNNLITNAIHAMGGRRTERVLTVTTEETGIFIRISVSDTGCGIPPEIMARIFDPFFTTKAPGKGTGLGLSISHGILQEHHGKIWAESDVGKGATFHIELPIVPVEESEMLATPAADTSKTRDGDQRRLLIVDDEPGIRDVLEVVLSGSGYAVSTANNGAEAMNLIGANKFDLVISDMCMPEMDGEKLYEAIRGKDPQLAKRILFVTGDTVSAKSRTFLERTGNRWLSKPFNIKDVEEVVSSYMREKPTVAEAVLAQLRN